MSARDDLSDAAVKVGTDVRDLADDWFVSIWDYTVNFDGWVVTIRDLIHDVLQSYVDSAPAPLNAIVAWLFELAWDYIAQRIFWAATWPTYVIRSIIGRFYDDDQGHYWPGVYAEWLGIAIANAAVTVYDYAVELTNTAIDLAAQGTDTLADWVGYILGEMELGVSGATDNLWWGVRDSYDSNVEALPEMARIVAVQIVTRVTGAVDDLSETISAAIQTVTDDVTSLWDWAVAWGEYLSDTLIPDVASLQTNASNAWDSIAALIVRVDEITDDPVGWVKTALADTVVDWLGDRLKAAW